MPNLVPSPTNSLIEAENVPGLLSSIRPHWQAKSLISRVKKLISVDPSSACQRLLNAAIHDLREKIVIAGIDIALEAARKSKLPLISRAEDIENYSNANTLDLCYNMGLLSRPEWRRLSRCYEIRRDLEHEDDEYEAGVEDIIYIFKTCIEVVLSKDPIHLIKVTDFKELVEQPAAATPGDALLEDFRQAPQTRQEEIGKFLLSVALDKKQPDLIQKNAFVFIGVIAPLLHSQARMNLGTVLQEKFGRQMDDRQARVANASGLMPYIRQAARSAFFEAVFNQMEKVTTNWSAYNYHGELLRSFEEYGGLDACPNIQQEKILRWLILTYIGTSGGRTSFGNVRNVFYSNSAAPLIVRLISDSKSNIGPMIDGFRTEKAFSHLIADTHIARRFEAIVDLADRDHEKDDD